jgi:AcrR family transcriptional regulator
MKKRRVRRDAADSRRVILEVAERQLRDSGPSALRLQDVAKAAGMSHPTVLHHFGSREGLIRAVVEHSAIALQQDLIHALSPTAAEPQATTFLDRVADTFSSRGHARLLAWLLLSGYDAIDSPTIVAGWEVIAKTMHARRIAAPATKHATYEDTRFTIVLSALAIFAQAVAGPAMFEAAGLGSEPAVERRFRKWLGDMLAQHLAAP